MSRLFKIASLATLTSQNSLLTILLHYVRLCTPSDLILVNSRRVYRAA